MKNSGKRGSEVAYLSIFGPLRDVIGSQVVVAIPEEGLPLMTFIKNIKRDYSCDISEYLNNPQSIFLINGKRLISNDFISTSVRRGDQLLITVAISGG